MVWLIIVIGLIFLAVKYRAFRMFLLIGCAVIALGIGAYLARERSEREEAKSLVRPDQLSFSEMTLGPEYGTTYTLRGRVKNNSPYEVKNVQVKVQVSDCDANGHCDVVGEEPEYAFVDVPPGQVRDLSESIYFSNMVIHGHFEWNYVVTQVEAAR